jgi:hypothetical protein
LDVVLDVAMGVIEADHAHGDDVAGLTAKERAADAVRRMAYGEEDYVLPARGGRRSRSPGGGRPGLRARAPLLRGRPGRQREPRAGRRRTPGAGDGPPDRGRPGG